MLNLSIGKKIAAGRKLKGFSQARLASSLCVTPQAVGKWERDESLPDIIMLLKIADIIGQDLNYFSKDESTTVIIPAEGSQQTEKSIARNMSMATWKDVDFSGLKNIQSKLDFASIEKCRFLNSDLSGIKFRCCNIKKSNFSCANLDDCTFLSSQIADNDFSKASMHNCTIKGSSISKNNYSGADLGNATFIRSNLTENNFAATIINKTEFNKCSFKKIEFSGKIFDCSFNYCTFKSCIFKEAILKDTFFKGCSPKDLIFSNCKADKLTVEFLKNANADTSTIAVIT